MVVTIYLGTMFRLPFPHFIDAQPQFLFINYPEIIYYFFLFPVPRSLFPLFWRCLIFNFQYFETAMNHKRATF